MTRTKRFLIVFLVALMTAALVAGCAQDTPSSTPGSTGSSSTVPGDSSTEEELPVGERPMPEELQPTSNKIVVWMKGDTEEFKPYYDGFLADYPDYELEYMTAATNDHVQLIQAIQAGQQVPDAVLVYPRPADAYYTGLYQSIDKYLDGDPNYKREYINEMALAGNTFGGKTYFVCEDLELCALGWNKKLFREAGLDPETPPATYSEFETMSKALTKYNSNGEATQIGYWGTIGYWALSSAMGRYVTGRDGFTVEFDTPEIRKAFEFSKSVPTFYNNKLAAADDTAYWDPKAGHVGFFYVNLKQISSFISEDLEIGLAPWPVADDYEGDPQICVYSSQQYGIPADAENPNGGWLFIRWLVTKGIGDVFNESQFNLNPNGYIPQYQSNSELREQVNEKFKPLVTNEAVLELWEKRDDMYENATMFLWSDVIESQFHPSIWASETQIYEGQVTITDQCAKIQALGEKLHQDWLDQKLADGWTFTEDKTALIPPND